MFALHRVESGGGGYSKLTTIPTLIRQAIRILQKYGEQNAVLWNRFQLPSGNTGGGRDLSHINM